MFKIVDHVEFDAAGRAHCPACYEEGKARRGKSLSLIPNTDGAYKCHRGCSPTEIRDAIGQSKPKQIPAALAQSAKVAPTTVSPQKMKEAHQRLMQPAGDRARQWLNDRGIATPMIQRYQLGLVRSKQGDRMVAAISIPIPANDEGTAYHQKKRIEPWTPADELPPECLPWSQKGIPAKVWFTYRPAEAVSSWVCEGEWDAMMLGWAVRQADLPVAVATFTCGCSAVPPDQELAKLPGDVTIFYDRNDKPNKNGIIPGEHGAQKLAQALGDRGRIGLVPMPDHCTVAGWDVSDALSAGHSIEEFTAAAAAAKPFTEAGPKPDNPLRDRLVWNDDLMNRASDYTQWLVDEILTSNELFLLAASPRAGKSLMAMTLAKAVAEGSEFLGRPTTQGTVVYVCMEDSENKLKERETAQGWAEGLPVAWLQRFKLSEIPQLKDLAEELDPRLIIIDTLSRVKDSSISESSAEMSQLLDPLQDMAKELDCCVLLVHHTGKVQIDTAGTIDVFDTIRGSSAIRAVCRGTLIIAADERNYRLCYENGWGKGDLNIVLDANTLTWRLIGKWAPTINGDQKTRVVEYLKQCQSASIDQMHADLNIPRDSLYKVLSRLALSDIAEEKVIKEGRKRCYVYRLAIFHQAKALLDYIGQSNTLSNSANTDGQSDRGPIGQKLLFFPDASGSIIDQTGTSPECDTLIDPESNFSKELVQYREKRGSNPSTARVSPIGQLLDKGASITASNASIASVSDDAALNGQLLDKPDQPARIDQLERGSPLEASIENEWLPCVLLRPWEKMLFSRKTRALEPAYYVEFPNGERQALPIPRLRLPGGDTDADG